MIRSRVRVAAALAVLAVCALSPAAVLAAPETQPLGAAAVTERLVRAIAQAPGSRAEGGRLQFTVQFERGVSPAAQRELVRQAGAAVGNEIPQLAAMTLQVAPNKLETAVAALRASAAVRAVNVRTLADPVDRPASWPTDIRLSAQWYYAAQGAPTLYAQQKLGLPSVTVAIVDTGIDAAHPDFAGANLILGPDIIDGDADPNDEDGHGTSIASVLISQPNNGPTIGSGTLVGIAPKISLMAVKVGTGQFGDDAPARGIVHAVDNGADVVNLSFGGYDQLPLIRSALEYAAERGVLVTCAVGNSGRHGVTYPAAYPGCIAVGATDLQGKIGRYSGRGLRVDLVAPGSHFVTNAPGGGTVFSSGTSLAAPMVAGGIALGMSEGLTPAQALQQLKDTADDMGPDGHDDHYGGGLINIARALGLGETTEAPGCSSAAVATPVGVSVTLQLSCGYPGVQNRQWCASTSNWGDLYFDCAASTQPFTVALASPPANGSITPEWDESVRDHEHTYGTDLTYNPAPGFSGWDSFVVRMQDPSRSTTARVRVYVGTPPQISCTDAAVSTYTGRAVQVPLSCSSQGQTLTLDTDSAPAHGTLSAITGSALVYTPVAGFAGSDSFTFSARDQLSRSAAATVTVTVRKPPVINCASKAVSVLLDSQRAISLTCSSQGQPLRLHTSAQPAHGTLSAIEQGVVVYTPHAGYVGGDSFTYTARDELSQAPAATVSISVRKHRAGVTLRQRRSSCGRTLRRACSYRAGWRLRLAGTSTPSADTAQRAVTIRLYKRRNSRWRYMRTIRTSTSQSASYRRVVPASRRMRGNWKAITTLSAGPRTTSATSRPQYFRIR